MGNESKTRKKSSVQHTYVIPHALAPPRGPHWVAVATPGLRVVEQVDGVVVVAVE
ncbi:hypothetical protein HC928_16020 [bacterium]|nr:hypothetical protein [bacterium]